MIRILDKLIYAISWSLAFVAAWVAPRDQKRLLNNIIHVLKIDEKNTQNKFAHKVRVSQIRITIEMLVFLLFPKVLRFIRCEKNPIEFADKSFLIITAHLGSWEIGGYFAQKYAPREFFVLAKPSRSKMLTKSLNWLRARLGMQVLWLSDPQLIRKMVRMLKAGSGLGFVMDQKPQGRIGPKVKFFNIETEFVSGPAHMLKKFGSNVFAIFVVRDVAPLTYRIMMEKVEFPNPDDEVASTQLMAHVIEKMIREFPEQWTWNYKRWKDL